MSLTEFFRKPRPDALTWLQAHTQKKSTRFWFLFLISFSVVSHLLGRLVKGKWWMNDFDALICGADYMRRGLSPYVHEPMCEGLKAAPYVYAPQIGAFLRPVIEVTGLTGARWLYAPFLIAALLVIAWYGLKRSFPNLPLHIRLLGYTIVSGSAVSCGNIAVICHAAAIGTALMIRRTRLPFLLVVLVSSIIKPVFLTYLIVLMYDARPLRSRLVWSAAGAAIGIGLYVWIGRTAGPLYEVWQKIIYDITLIEQPGYTFLAWAEWIGLRADHPATLIAFAVYFPIMALAGLLLCDLGKLSLDTRLLIGLGMAQLINPRMMSYDMLFLPTMLAAVVMVARDYGERIFSPVSWTFLWIGVAGFFMAVLPIKDFKPADIMSPAFVALVLWVSLIVIRQNKDIIRQTLKNPKPFMGAILQGRL
ncbi:hypothetical protein ATDW_31370 [Asticcacaulis sp. DW145]|uniref:DUF2029 domain-containing protein n=1 Tax=Asticcacaulis currens TaxID=2984210 RepID=A0ABT5IIE0_9CAUL|nr:hypothetical protein [Asticcacaulis currens]MDC7695231.1 hypothetical protein [Asticcacaulis currens]BEV12641.1 hypothetical protein ATDW_31370 [Asticcacaulis sp. DW145]